MKLRWVERRVKVPTEWENIFSPEIVKVLQYWDAVDNSMQYGRWIDVPLEVEE